MAKKITFNDMPAYQEGILAIVKLTDGGLWHVFHIDSGKPVMHILPGFIQKKDALTYALEILNLPIKWDFKDQAEFNKINNDVLQNQIPIITGKWLYQQGTA